ncbi:hypothetical protein Goklo_012970 [Gossypium klotzschianum]|uniref:Uncharacterized protein n=1 Tax=Gossypium klotzschianum TaxID=34286 RepID=A0A7J8VE31_9ROSI|nr:hypothetical protein [Gossypium klotzschianum]
MRMLMGALYFLLRRKRVGHCRNSVNGMSTILHRLKGLP